MCNNISVGSQPGDNILKKTAQENIVTQVLFCLLLAILVMKATTSSSAQSIQLPACPVSPNCVSSQAADIKHQVAPLLFTGDSELAWLALINTVASVPRSRIIEQSSDTIRLEVTSLVFRFIDDVIFLLDAANKEIHVRSASRVGYSDFGVNRHRVESIRKQFLKHIEKLDRE